MSAAEPIDTFDVLTCCAACGADYRRAQAGGIYAPAGARCGIIYMLCAPCYWRFRFPETKHDVMCAVELRLDPPRGSA